MGKLKQLFCTHYHETTRERLPIFDLYPRRRIFGLGLGAGIREAKRDFDAVRCLNCGLHYFVTDGKGFLL